ncbi:hypothetical protein J9B83_10265 [Marinomonas sp. A79]|uniref:Uncharacterized protein n=1 Tax=Marinomonas vulgaris TaxID=2823372 RepID=A0ABS5HCE7_9GAMM|nr:hypothetical protein [Marinomonas vulgaris]MBR7889326.1 hypothetical protein [Marinomonas vulgaris]
MNGLNFSDAKKILSDALGKLGFSYDSRSIVLQNWEGITKEIERCALWKQAGLMKMVNRMKNRMNGAGWGAATAGRLLYRIYLLSAWYNKSKYL